MTKKRGNKRPEEWELRTRVSPLIKEYTVTNFKVFADPAIIPIKPITLIFGPNSSGKSSIFQSLLLAKQTLEEGKTSSLLSKGKLIDLGSFEDFIHGHDIKKSFSIKMTFPSKDLIAALMNDLDIPTYIELHTIDNKKLRELISEETTAGISLNFHETKDSIPTLRDVELQIGNDPEPVITYTPFSLFSPETYYLKWKWNFNHKFWHKYWSVFDSKSPENIDIMLDAVLENIKNKKNEVYEVYGRAGEDMDIVDETGEKIDTDKERRDLLEQIKNRVVKTKQIKGKVKNFKTALQVYKLIFNEDNEDLILDGILPDRYGSYYPINRNDKDEFKDRDPSLVAISLGKLIKRFLKKCLYIGPLREFPERFYLYRGAGTSIEDVGITGKAFPYILLNDEKIRDKVNREFKRFGYDYRIEVLRLKDDKGDQNYFLLQIVDESTSISSSLKDVGFGFSQVLPIIVQSLKSQEQVLIIEQPELHLHPAMQAELGDLFINSALGKQKNTFLIETHSEHLILRIMRRMRETFEKKLPPGYMPITPEDVAVLYVEHDGTQSHVREMPLNERGELVKAWPGGFFEEGLREVLS